MRLFLAAMPDAKARDELHDFANQVCSPNDKVTHAANLHVTLRFFGEVDSQAIPSFKRAINAAARDTRQFTLTPKALVAMPPPRPSILWLELDKSATLAALFAYLSDGIPPLNNVDAKNLRRGLRAHFTLSRKSRTEKKIALMKQHMLPAAIAIDRIALLQSPPSVKDGLYPCLHEARLAQ